MGSLSMNGVETGCPWQTCGQLRSNVIELQFNYIKMLITSGHLCTTFKIINYIFDLECC